MTRAIDAVTARHERRTGVASRGDVAGDLRAVRVRDHRTDHAGDVEAVADPHAARERGEPVDERVVDRVVHADARARHAVLSLQEERRHGDAGDREFEVGIVHHDDRRLAAEFERDLFEVAERGLDDLASGRGRAGERDLVDPVMRGQRGARRRAETRHDVDDAGRKARFEREFAEQQDRQRRFFRRLDDDRAAGGQRRRELEDRGRQRHVPRHDLTGDTDRFPQRVGQRFRDLRYVTRRHHRAALDADRGRRVVVEHLDAVRDREVRDEARHAVVEHLEFGEQRRVAFDEAREARDGLRAVEQRQARPRPLERASRGCDRPIDVERAAQRDAREFETGRGIVRRARLSVDTVDPRAVDQEAMRAREKVAGLGGDGMAVEGKGVAHVRWEPCGNRSRTGRASLRCADSRDRRGRSPIPAGDRRCRSTHAG